MINDGKMLEAILYNERLMKFGGYSPAEIGNIFEAQQSDNVVISTVAKIVKRVNDLGLKHEDKELTEEKTGEILDILFEEHGIEYVAELLGDAISKAFGIKETPGQSHSWASIQRKP